jgi:phosphoglucosamine mutase
MTQAYPHFGTDGVRGTAGENLTTQFVYCLGRAIVEAMGAQEFLIGRDTRMSGKELSDALISGLVDASASATNIGILTTPAIAVNADHKNVAACVITASHNPAEDNGIKVFDVGGNKISEETERSIETQLFELIESSATTNIVHHDIDANEAQAAQNFYEAFLLNACGQPDLSSLTIAIDCANGASFDVAPRVFEHTGAKVIAINTESDGQNINNQCGATHLDPLMKLVGESQADIGFAFDGDADRVICVDDKGVLRDGDYILALFAEDLHERGALINNTVVATSMSNGALKQLLESDSIVFCETPVGDKYVASEMARTGAVLGGEQSGHIIRSDKSQWGDGILNALLISDVLVRSKKTPHDLLNLFHPMAQLHGKIAVAHKAKAQENSAISTSINKELEGLGDGARIIVRPSGTEDVVRITVEAQDEAQANESLARLSSLVEEVCG